MTQLLERTTFKTSRLLDFASEKELVAQTGHQKGDWPLVVLGSLGVFIGGVTWSWMYRKYRSVWVPYVSHAMVDIAIFAVGADVLFG